MPTPSPAEARTPFRRPCTIELTPVHGCCARAPMPTKANTRPSKPPPEGPWGIWTGADSAVKAFHMQSPPSASVRRLAGLAGSRTWQHPVGPSPRLANPLKTAEDPVAPPRKNRSCKQLGRAPVGSSTPQEPERCQAILQGSWTEALALASLRRNCTSPSRPASSRSLRRLADGPAQLKVYRSDVFTDLCCACWTSTDGILSPSVAGYRSRMAASAKMLCTPAMSDNFMIALVTRSL
mmetsp:Transcript_12499/g.25957  ORF Transcript_12499/g.25957 Transcript_12499/m.25957 type:complete len:237 (+) Transcript_12499:241-951(+)